MDAAINERPHVINGTSVTITCLKAVQGTKKVHVGNLPTTMDEEALKQYFAPLGTIVAVGVKSRQASASAWVEFQVVDPAIFSGRHLIGDRDALVKRFVEDFGVNDPHSRLNLLTTRLAPNVTKTIFTVMQAIFESERPSDVELLEVLAVLRGERGSHAAAAGRLQMGHNSIPVSERREV
ncbi:hypothetical protein Ciccas_009539 [Cichlidogyrus casuarinus]|uniref:RRM domain-containing protein n=1 Tax=Cichlidogyrus casuarinus TaxID=1844966 RepID=A0ABD2PZI4_9PLAT